MSKHTKGPWFDEYTCPISRHNSTKFRVETSDGDLICVSGDIKRSDHGFYEQQANARLIAAAPEMLEALERLFFETRLEISPEFNDQLVALIARARGDEGGV